MSASTYVRTEAGGSGRPLRAVRSLGRLRVPLTRDPAAQRPPSPSAWPTSAFAMLGLVCLWMVAQMLVLGDLSQSRAQDGLYQRLRTDLASATAPIGPVVPVGDPVALLSIPQIGLEQVVVEGTASGDLLVGPGHRRDTALPGQEGTSVVYGRAATYGAPFGDLDTLLPGDDINVVTSQGETTFTVIAVRTQGDPLSPPAETGHARLTLVTASGTGRWAGLSPGETMYVDAEARTAFPTPPGRPTSVPVSELAMATEPTAMPLLVLCLALLLGLAVATVRAVQRWSPALVWVVVAPVAIALAWLTTDVVMRLLPNLM